MKYSSTMTSKGQVTIPVDIRRILGLKPGQAITFDLSGEVATIEQPAWRKDLVALHVRVQAHMHRKGIEPLSDRELDDEINKASKEAALRRDMRNLEA